MRKQRHFDRHCPRGLLVLERVRRHAGSVDASTTVFVSTAVTSLVMRALT